MDINDFNTEEEVKQKLFHWYCRKWFGSDIPVLTNMMNDPCNGLLLKSQRTVLLQYISPSTTVLCTVLFSPQRLETHWAVVHLPKGVSFSALAIAAMPTELVRKHDHCAPDQPVRPHLLKVKELWDPSPPRPSVSCYSTQTPPPPAYFYLISTSWMKVNE